ncbi:MAG TPA: YsnF/AvaK domain-containing protein, partial [Flavisolibacter sp.]
EANLYKNRPRSGDTRSDETIPVVKEELEVGKREVESGGIRLRSRIVENEVSEDLNLRQETVQVERNTVDRPATGGDFKEEELEMRAHDEVPVVNKSARVVEEISLNKDVTEREETIRENLKSTEVSMNDDSNSDLNMDDDDIRNTGGRDTEQRKDGGFL